MSYPKYVTIDDEIMGDGYRFIPRVVLKSRDNIMIASRPDDRELGVSHWHVITPGLKVFWVKLEGIDGCLFTIRLLFPDRPDRCGDLGDPIPIEGIEPGSMLMALPSPDMVRAYREGKCNRCITGIMKHYGITDYKLPKEADRQG